MQKTYVIGDIHGCHKPLNKLLDAIAPDMAVDRIIFLGDYIDRGPDSNLVIDTILDLCSQSPNVITLMGNHEQAFLDYLAGKYKEYYLMIGGLATVHSYGINDPLHDDPLVKIPQQHIGFLKSLIHYWEDEEYIYVHAGLKPGVHLTQQSMDWLLWVKEEFTGSDYDFGKRVIFGHSASTEPIVTPNKIGIDTGAVFGGRLTCLILPELKFVSVNGSY